jgi:pentatricopeptide repeat protein
VSPAYDVFISYAHKDKEAVGALVAALRAEGLRVFIDEAEVGSFHSIQSRVEQGIAKSKVLLAWYSVDYARSRACQWELAAGYLWGSGERVCVVNPTSGTDHIQPRSLLDKLFATASDPTQVARDVWIRAAGVGDGLGDDPGCRRSRFFGFQPAGSNRFVGRVPELWAMHDAVLRSASPMLSGVARSIVQIRGLGGIGKSLLTEEYALRFGAAFPGGIFWLKAFGSDSNKSVEDREADRMQQIREFAAQIPLPVEQKPFPEVWAMLERELPKAPCLWIVDDVPPGLSREQLSRWFSPHPSIPTLLIIPDLSHDDLGVKIDLDALTPEESLALLRSHKLNDGEGADALRLVEALERHPLAIEIAASYLEFRNGAVSCGQFLEQVRTRARDELEFAAKLKHSASLVTALSATWKLLSAPAIDLLALASVLASAPIPAEVIDVSFARLYDCSPEDAEEKRLEATSDTDQFALSRVDPARPEARRVHSLVARAARQHVVSPERVAIIKAAAVAALSEYALRGLSYARVFRLGLESSHARELSANPATGDEAALLVVVGSFDLARGEIDSAERSGRRALDYCMSTLGADHDFTRRAKGLVGQVLFYRGDYGGARAIFEPLVEAAARDRAPGDVYRLGGQLSLAAVLNAQGELGAARVIAEKAVEESTSVNGLEHQWTLSAKTILAQIMTALGDNARAVALVNGVLAARRRQAAEGDPDILFEEFSLIAAQGIAADLREAEPVLNKAVEVFTREFGAENTVTLQARLYQLFVLLQKGQRADAQHRADDLIGIFDRVFGSGHPMAIQARVVQACTLFVDNRYDEASARLEPLVAQLARALGPHHPEVIAIQCNFAAALLETGGQQRACEMLRALVVEAEEHLGKAHPNSIASRCTLFSCLCKLGQFAEARTAWQELIANPAARSNPFTYTGGNSIALGLREQNDLPGAQSVLLEMVPFAEAQLGAEHAIVVIAKTSLAFHAAALGQFADAAQWWEQVLAAKDHTVGERDPGTTQVAWNLFLTRWRMGEAEECHRIFVKRFLWFCAKDESRDPQQTEICSAIRQNTPWLSAQCE